MAIHHPELEADALRTVVAHNTTAPAGWSGWIALAEHLPSDGGHGERAPDTDVAATWRMFTTQTYASSILPLVATREALQNSIDAIRLLARFMRWGKIARKEEAVGALIANPDLGERFWTALAAGQVPALGKGGVSGRFDVTWDADTRTISWEDDGIGMDLPTLRTAFFRIPGTRKGAAGGGSEQTAGGFGIAKAVILGCGTGGFEIHTRNNRATGWHVVDGQRVYRTEAAPPRVGTQTTIRDVIWNYKKDYSTGAMTAVPANGGYDLSWDRRGSSMFGLLREVLSVSDLPGLEVTLNGEPVTSAFAGRGKPHPELGGTWMQGPDGPLVEATVKSFRREDSDGAAYIRLNGLYQFRRSGEGEYKRDYVIDLDVRLTPDDPAYPLLNSREAFKRPVADRFDAVCDRIRDQNKDPHPVAKDYDVFLPKRKDADEAQGGREIAQTVDAVLADPAVQAAMVDTIGAAKELIDAMFKERDAEARATARHQQANPPEDTSGMAGYGALEPAAAKPVEPEDVGALPPSAPRATFDFVAAESYTAPEETSDWSQTRENVLYGAKKCKTVIDQFTAQMERTDPEAPWSVRSALRTATYHLSTIVESPTDSYYRSESKLTAILAGLKACVTLAYRTAGSGILDAVRVRPGLDALAYLARESGVGTEFALELTKASPFGGIGALKVKRFVGPDVPEAVKARRRAFVYRFRKNYAKWVPYLLAWDATLRVLVREGQLVRKKGSERNLLGYIPDFYPGFVLDPGLHGMAAVEPTEDDDRSVNVIYINPEDLAAVVRAHKTRPIAIAGFLFNIACHELTHMNGNMGDGHDNNFIKEREYLADSTCHLLPVIEAIVQRTLRLPGKADKSGAKVAKMREKNEGLAAEVAKKDAEIKRLRARLTKAEEGGVTDQMIEDMAGAFARTVRTVTNRLPSEEAARTVAAALEHFLENQLQPRAYAPILARKEDILAAVRVRLGLE